MRLPLAVALLAGGLVANSGLRSVEGEVARVASSTVQVGIDCATGALVEFRNRASGFDFADPGAASGGCWELDFGGGVVLGPTNAAFCKVVSSAGRPDTLVILWDDFGRPEAPGLGVEVSVALDQHQPSSRWQIAVRNAGSYRLAGLRFPRFFDLARQAGERLAVPEWLGKETADPRGLVRGDGGPPRRLAWAYPGLLSLQCIALTAEGGTGLYAACDDTSNRLKEFAVFGGGRTGLNLEILHRPEGGAGAGADYALPYGAVVGLLQGGWFEAAARYRDWGTNQPWARASRLRQGLTPAWVTNTALWVWNRGPSPGVIDPALILRGELGLPVSVFWHWWHGCAYDVGFPEYLPPREGAGPFRSALERAQGSDVHGIVYMNQRLWGMTTASWTNRNAARAAVKAADGRIVPEVYNTFTRSPCASMCLGTQFWRDTYAGLATAAFSELGVDGIYMDQACSSLACYDPGHGHTLGGGTYWMEGFKSLAADIRRRCAPRGVPALAGEGCGENWLPHLDLMLALQVSRERYAAPDGWEPIPFFHAVYHGYSVFYGNYSSLTMPPYDQLWPGEFAPREPLKLLDRAFSRQFYLEQARAFVWGQQPTIANFRPSHLRERPEEIGYVMRLARLHAGARPFLLHGTMLPPPRLTVPAAELDMSRLSIYAGQQGGLKEFRKTVPQVWAAAWRSPEGRVAVALASVSDQSLRPTLELDAIACGVASGGRLYRVDAAGRRLLGRFGGVPLVLKPELAPRDACLLELEAPAADEAGEADRHTSAPPGRP